MEESAPSNRPFLKVSAIVACVILGFGVASLFPSLVLTLITSGLVAFVLRPFVLTLEFYLGMRRTFAIAIVFLTVGGLQAFLAVKGFPLLISAGHSMYDSFKNFPFDEKLNEAARQLTVHLPLINPTSLTQKMHGLIEGSLRSLQQGLTAAASFAVDLAIVPFITFFILAEWDSALKRLIEQVPNKYFEMTLNVINKIQTDLIGYLRGWILDSVIIGILSIIGYYVLGLDYAILIGVMMGISNLIPYVGPIFGIIPAFLVAIAQTGDFRLFVPILILTVAVQTLDNVIVQPLCFSKTVDMHPVTVIFVCLIGNTLMGIPGMLLAIPVATILKASAVETYWGLKHYQITAS